MATTSRMPVNIKPIQTNFTGTSSIKRLVIIPITPVIKVATITAKIMVCFGLSPSSGFRIIMRKNTQIKSIIVFLKKITTATSVAT